MNGKFYWQLLIYVLVFVVNSSSQTQPVLSAEAFEKAIVSENSQILDVRTNEEYKNGHLANAFLADWTDREIFTDRVQYLDKGKPVYTYCLGGSRSDAAAAWLKQNGFREVYSLEGGITSWKKAAKPVESVARPKQITMKEYLSGIPKNSTTLIEVGAPWCIPCKKMEPVLESLKKEHGDLFTLIRINGSEQEKLLKQIKIDQLPAFIIYREGKEVWRKQGIVTEIELLAQLK